jgi:hypothetical protein
MHHGKVISFISYGQLTCVASSWTHDWTPFDTLDISYVLGVNSCDVWENHDDQIFFLQSLQTNLWASAEAVRTDESLDQSQMSCTAQLATKGRKILQCKHT